jgi:hypothetical protein
MKRKAQVIFVLAVALMLGLTFPLAAQCPSASCPAETLGSIELAGRGSTASGFVQIRGFA